MIIYTACLALGLIFTIISATIGHFFGGHDGGGDVGTGGHAEAGYDHSGVPGISFFSPTVLACFVTAFGACGLILSRIDATKNIWISAPISAVAGAGMAGVAFLLFNAMFKHTQSSSESRVGDLIGQTASINSGPIAVEFIHGGALGSPPAHLTRRQSCAISLGV